MFDFLAAATAEAAHNGGGMGWQWIPGLVGGGGLAGIIVMLAKQKLFSGTFRIGGGTDNGGDRQVCHLHGDLVKHVEDIHGTVSKMDGKLDVLITLIDNNDSKKPPIQT